MVAKPRLFAAFLIAPIVPALLVLAFSIMFDELVYYEFILGMGALVGYLFATILGGPAYILYFRKLDPVRKLPFVCFTLACLAGYCILFGSIMVSQDGFLALLSPTFLGYGVIFFVSTSIAVAAFYLIAFQEFRSTKG
ncbi:hypothetical protein [Tabrizicola sp.]|uniref:hypothetical protein n=1 Tax=Tabrizicola sp. TaxID=2005166 RepID=UPI003F346E4D